jgi:hypothetical protein
VSTPPPDSGRLTMCSGTDLICGCAVRLPSQEVKIDLAGAGKLLEANCKNCLDAVNNCDVSQPRTIWHQGPAVVDCRWWVYPAAAFRLEGGCQCGLTESTDCPVAIRRCLGASVISCSIQRRRCVTANHQTAGLGLGMTRLIGLMD